MVKQTFKKQYLSYANSIFIVLLIVSSIFLIWKCRFGFGNIDECFYLTVPYRLLQGDVLLQDEWHLSQMAGILTVPFVGAYLGLHGSSEGLLLAMRYITTGVWCLVAVYLYIRLRQFHPLSAILASISYLLFIPFGLPALSYNSMGIMFVVLATVTVLTAQTKPHMQQFLAGLCYAAAVLCCPYMLLIFLLYLGVVAVRWGVRRILKCGPDHSVWNVPCALYISAGAAAAAICFVAFLLSRGTIRGILQSLSPMLNDPEHPPVDWILKTKGFVVFILRSNPLAQKLYYAMAAIAIIYLLDAKQKHHRGIYTSLITAGILVLMYSYCHFNNYINQIMWSVNIFAIFIFLFTNSTTIRSIFYTVWIPGILYAYCVYMGSNQEFNAISSAGSAASVGSMAMIVLYFLELLQDTTIPLRKLSLALICAALVFQFAAQVQYRYSSVFWDSDMKSMTTCITEGIEKGLYTTPENVQSYYQDLATIRALEEYQPDKFLHLARKTWYYLHMDAEMTPYSAWLSGVTDNTLDRLEIYYQINPDKRPDLVYVDPEYTHMIQQFCDRFSYHRESVINGGTVLLPN